MANKLISKSELSLQVEESNNVLPDESDQIIVDLKNELSQLKQHLLHYEAEEKKHSLYTEVPLEPEDGTNENLQIQLQIKKHQIKSLLAQQKAYHHRQKILPHVMENLQKPISQMTSDLQKIISNVQDPEVKATLGQCFSVLEKVDNISKHSQRLDQDLETHPKKVDLLSFFKRIARSQSQEGPNPVKLFTSHNVPQSFYIDEELFKNSILIILKEISRLSEEDTISITLRQGNETVYDINVEHLKISLFGETAWDLPPREEMEAYLAKCLDNDSNWGVDLLYAQKIVEKHGGTLSFHQENEETLGFDISLPQDSQ